MKDFSVLWNEKYNALVPSASQYLVRYTVFEPKFCFWCLRTQVRIQLSATFIEHIYCWLFVEKTRIKKKRPRMAKLTKYVINLYKHELFLKMFQIKDNSFEPDPLWSFNNKWDRYLKPVWEDLNSIFERDTGRQQMVSIGVRMWPFTFSL